MDALECLRTRASVRKFKPDPVPKEVLTEIIDAATWSPSYKNSQPWELVVVSGEKKEALTKMLTDLFEQGTTARPDIPEPASWPSPHDERIQYRMSKQGAQLGIDFNDPEMRKRSKLANFRFYGAPHGIFLFQEASLTPWSILDAGMFAQSLMLAAHAKGLGTVPQAFLTDYAPEIKNFLSIPESKRLLLGISIGYPKPLDPAKVFKTERDGADKIARWVE